MLELELSAIWKACLLLDNDDNPPIAFLVVQKRHDTHLFLDNPRDEVNFNVYGLTYFIMDLHFYLFNPVWPWK